LKIAAQLYHQLLTAEIWFESASYHWCKHNHHHIAFWGVGMFM